MLQFLICVTILPIVMGLGLITLKKEKGTESLTECYMIGLLFLFLLGEAASCIVIKLEESFSFYCILLAGCIAFFAAVSLAVGKKQIGRLLGQRVKALQKDPEGRSREQKKVSDRIWNGALFLLLIALPAAGLFLYVPDAGNSTIAETISVTMASDTVFGYNPVTGQILEYGMYPLYKFTALPLLYSAVCRLCGMAFTDFVFYAVPVWVLCLFAAVLSLLGDCFFEGNKEKKRIFLLLLGVLLVSGDGETGTLAYGLLHSGFRGEVLASAVVIPFGVYMLYCFFGKKDRWYAAAGILLSFCGIIAARPLFLPDSAAFSKGDGGREWMLAALFVFALYLAREKTKKKWKRQEVLLLGCSLLFGMISGGIFAAAGMAYAGACLFGIAKERKTAASFVTGAVLIIALAGTVLPFRGACVKRADIPKGDIQIQERIAELIEDYEKEVILAAPENVMEWARLTGSKAVLPYGKDLWRENCNREIADVYTDKELLLFEQMKTDYLQPDTAAAMAAEMHCGILVLREEMSEEMRIRGGWQEAEPVSGYAVYFRQP